MRQLAGYIVAGAVTAAVAYVSIGNAFSAGPDVGATADFGWQAAVVFAICIAAVMFFVVGIVTEVRHLRNRRRDREWSLTTGGGPRA
jgi:hypothetical protein